MADIAKSTCQQPACCLDIEMAGERSWLEIHAGSDHFGSLAWEFKLLLVLTGRFAAFESGQTAHTNGWRFITSKIPFIGFFLITHVIEVSTMKSVSVVFKRSHVALFIAALSLFCVSGAMAADNPSKAGAEASKYVYRGSGNPYLPLWEHVPDGEPRVFEDPDHPGKFRAYIVGSHDVSFRGIAGRTPGSGRHRSRICPPGAMKARSSPTKPATSGM